ncbi:hypothetical protein BG006_011158 [Podila minutissima]|uniref:Uncharacterized protein n=1 Tax=Podila minutissima TaxID=64525 RepID=A0A9P5SFY3_9FUNG|nr:hypothetical protein BG006_011158 [Podila minutissima]
MLANVYEIYPQLDEPHACCVTKVLAWFEWIETNGLCKLSSEDFLFPQLTKGDHIQPRQPFSVSLLSNRLNKYAHDAGLMDHGNGLFDKHCFRRGGALHRLVHGQDPWSFQSVKWWGGWTEKDPAEEIREYLWAETNYESSFGYMLWHHGSKTHGDTSSTSLSLEVQVIRERFESAIQSMDSRYTAALAKIEKENQELRQQLAELGVTFAQQLGKAVLALKPQEFSDTHQPQLQLDPPQPQRPSSEPQPDLPKPSPDLSQPPQDHRKLQLTPQPTPQPVLIQPIPPQPVQSQQIQSQPTRTRSRPPKPKPLQHQRAQAYGHSTPKQNARAPTITHWKEAGESEQEDDEQPSEEDSDVGTTQPTVHIIPRCSDWKEVIRQWDEGDTENGLNLPLSQWPQEWKKHHTTYYTRKAIVTEFESFGRDESRMRRVHGADINSLWRLVRSIRARLRERKGQLGASQEGRQVGLVSDVDDDDDDDDDDNDEEQSRDEDEEDESRGKRKHHTDDGGTATGPATLPMIEHWRDAVKQRKEGDPDQGLTVPPRDWPAEMPVEKYTQRNPNKRKLVAEMRQEHGANMDQINHMLASIKGRDKRQKKQEKLQELREQTQEQAPEEEDGHQQVPEVQNGQQVERQEQHEKEEDGPLAVAEATVGSQDAGVSQ